jgi:type I restriction enzyme S subunit
VRLEEIILLIKNGTTVKQNKECRGLPVSRIETITDEKINPIRVGYIENLDQSLVENYKLDVGDILFSHINSDPHLGKAAIYDGNPEILIHGMNLLRIKPNPNIVLSKFLNYIFRYFRQVGIFIKMAQRAIGQSSINQTKLKELQIPLAPLIEQHRVVEKLETLTERVREAKHLRTEARQDADHLMQAALADVFPRPESSLPEGWQCIKLEEMCEHRSGIWGPEAHGLINNFPIVRSTEILGFRINPLNASVRFVPSSRAQMYILQPGDILVNKSSGSQHLVGWPAIFEDPGDGRVYLFSNFMQRLRLDKH